MSRVNKKTEYSVVNDDSNVISEPYISWDLDTAATKIGKGLATTILEIIQARLQISNSQLSDLMMVSPRTLDRRKKEESLPPDESERSYRIARLTDRAYQVFENPEKVARWFSESNFALGNKTPLDMAKTEPGARLVEQLLGRIEHGITV